MDYLNHKHLKIFCIFTWFLMNLYPFILSPQLGLFILWLQIENVNLKCLNTNFKSELINSFLHSVNLRKIIIPN